MTLIERTPPPRGGFLFTMLPHQEPCVRGPSSKNLYQVLCTRGGGFLSINVTWIKAYGYICNAVYQIIQLTWISIHCDKCKQMHCVGLSVANVLVLGQKP